MRSVAIWAALAAALTVPVVIAATSPVLAWRDPVYIVGGLAGVVGLALLLLQPLLAGGGLPGLPARRARHLHALVGAGLVTAVTLHVGGLWLTSPPDVVDALLFRSPTSFSAWGVIAMWAAFAAALVATFRRRMRPLHWRLCHLALGLMVVLGSIIHALLIDGSMGTISKVALCVLVAAAAARLVWQQRWSVALRRRPRPARATSTTPS